MTWVAAQVVLREPALQDQYIPIVRHGVDFLADVMWDKQDGGFFWGLDDEGKITSAFGDEKELYGIGFCIYGAAAAYQATKDPKALKPQRMDFMGRKRAHDSVTAGILNGSLAMEHGSCHTFLMERRQLTRSDPSTISR